MKCTSCNKEVTDNYIKMKCPGCNKELTRCQECRDRGSKYTCSECGFTGP